MLDGLWRYRDQLQANDTFRRVAKPVHDVFLPAHISSLRDIEDALPGYRLAFRGLEDFEFNVDNFPPAHRVGRCADLLFLPI